MLRKKCIKPQCGRVYKEDEVQFEINECDCGAPLKPLSDFSDRCERDKNDENVDNIETPITSFQIEESIEEDKKEEVLLEKEHIDFIEVKKMKCSNCDCGLIFEEGHEAYEDGFCTECGYALEEYSEKVSTSNVEVIEKNMEVDSLDEKVSEVKADETYNDCEEIKEYGDILKYSVDENKYIHFPGEDGYIEDTTIEDIVVRDEHENYEGDRLVIYSNKLKYKTIPLIYDETVIGRKSTSSAPDIDLTDIDLERKISRNHALIYRYQGDYYIRNISSKNSLHVNSQALLLNEQTKLENGSKIILSRFLGIIFYLAGGEINE